MITVSNRKQFHKKIIRLFSIFIIAQSYSHLKI